MAYDYDSQIDFLTKNPHKINEDWSFARGLFNFVGDKTFNYGKTNGCLTMIRQSPEQTEIVINGELFPKLHKEIANDERIPKDQFEIKVEHLPIFKEWQQRIDNIKNETHE